MFIVWFSETVLICFYEIFLRFSNRFTCSSNAFPVCVVCLSYGFVCFSNDSTMLFHFASDPCVFSNDFPEMFLCFSELFLSFSDRVNMFFKCLSDACLTFSIFPNAFAMILLCLSYVVVMLFFCLFYMSPDTFPTLFRSLFLFVRRLLLCVSNASPMLFLCFS